jgi:hypothetical protein
VSEYLFCSVFPRSSVYHLALKLNGHTEILRYLHLILDATASLTYTGKRRSPQAPQHFHLPFSSQVALHPKQLHVEAVPSRPWCVQRGSRRVTPRLLRSPHHLPTLPPHQHPEHPSRSSVSSTMSSSTSTPATKLTAKCPVSV